MNGLAIRTFLVVIVAVGGLTAQITARARAEPSVHTLGAHGYDVVMIRTEEKAEFGDFGYRSYYNGTTYLFTGAASKSLFDEGPERYLPEYGGYCAYGMAVGAKLPGDPKTFSIVDGKLYFNLNMTYRERFLADSAENIRKATERWSAVKGASPQDL